MSTPDFMPALKKGCHLVPKDGACVMEYVSFITGDKFTDHPACTPHNLALVAQAVNDFIYSDALRAEYLTPLIPRLLGAGQDRKYDERIQQFIKGLMMTEGCKPSGSLHNNVIVLSGARREARGWLQMREPDEIARVLAESYVSILNDVLDDYDLYLKRETPESLTPEQVESVERLTALITA